MKLKLNKPTSRVRLETTGINTSKDRIVEMYLIKIQVDGQRSNLSIAV
ncbi:MAG: hypothetical protein R2852_09335 [Bacteroidia bacterium]